MDGTGFAGDRRQASSHGYSASLKPAAGPVGAGLPAKQATQWMAPASPVIAGKPAPTGTAQVSSPPQALWERVYPRSRRRGGWHRLRRCSRVNLLPQRASARPSAAAVSTLSAAPCGQSSTAHFRCHGTRSHPACTPTRPNAPSGSATLRGQCQRQCRPAAPSRTRS